MQPRGCREGRSDDAGRGGAGWVPAGRGEARSHAPAHPDASHALLHAVSGQRERKLATGTRHPLGRAEVEGAGDALWRCHCGFASLNQKDQFGEPRRDVQPGSRPAGRVQPPHSPGGLPSSLVPVPHPHKHGLTLVLQNYRESSFLRIRFKDTDCAPLSLSTALLHTSLKSGCHSVLISAKWMAQVHPCQTLTLTGSHQLYIINYGCIYMHTQMFV